MDEYILPYTICIIKRGNQILLMNKEANVWMGRWNGIGGKIHTGETPTHCIVREMKEETGITVSDVSYKGIVTWPLGEHKKGGMYLFLVELPLDYSLETPIKNREGVLDWKEISWILHPDNSGIVDSLSVYLPIVLRQEGLFEYHCVFEKRRLIEFTCEPIVENFLSEVGRGSR